MLHAACQAGSMRVPAWQAVTFLVNGGILRDRGGRGTFDGCLSLLLCGGLMSWSVVVNNLQEFDGFDLNTVEFLASQHPSYPRDAMYALTAAKMVGLKSATLSGGRTPNPYGGDEIADISIRGTPMYKDFLLEMREIIAAGPGPESALALHFAALARLRERPCSHVFESAGQEDQPGLLRCVGCRVYLNGTMLYFEE